MHHRIVLCFGRCADEEIGVNHGIVDVFAYQEALLIEAAFGLALLAMIWVGFRRWLQHKERLGSLIAERTAERATQYHAEMESVQARLKAIEQLVIESRVQREEQIPARPVKSAPTRRDDSTSQ
jgi:hypothetical protein